MNEVLKWFEDNTYYSVVSGNVTFDIQNHDYWEFQKLLVKQCDELEEKDEELEEKDEEINRLNNIIDKVIEKLSFYNDKENNMYVPVNEIIDLLQGDDK